MADVMRLENKLAQYRIPEPHRRRPVVVVAHTYCSKYDKHGNPAAPAVPVHDTPEPHRPVKHSRTLGGKGVRVTTEAVHQRGASIPLSAAVTPKTQRAAKSTGAAHFMIASSGATVFDHRQWRLTIKAHTHKSSVENALRWQRLLLLGARRVEKFPCPRRDYSPGVSVRRRERRLRAPHTATRRPLGEEAWPTRVGAAGAREKGRKKAGLGGCDAMRRARATWFKRNFRNFD
ncbi:hypothetical protein HPB51_004067 [Rhipicephalus microplus]|uniref:Uncharacterized protein n=1 Tax=Rhipicephalus microplus TaxID=6941 RepID=A0A9J6EWN9_RHIMP|nr:hypothetical protein HPB51_004067 [Rhipicephalus microplus]